MCKVNVGHKCRVNVGHGRKVNVGHGRKVNVGHGFLHRGRRTNHCAHKLSETQLTATPYQTTASLPRTVLAGSGKENGFERLEICGVARGRLGVAGGAGWQVRMLIKKLWQYSIASVSVGVLAIRI